MFSLHYHVDGPISTVRLGAGGGAERLRERGGGGGGRIGRRRKSGGLSVRLLLLPGDQGWDVFSLHYHVDGPISTVRLGAGGGAGREREKEGEGGIEC